MFESQVTPLNAFGSFSQGYQMVDESINRQQQIAMKQQQLAQEQATQQQELAQKQAILSIGQEAARTGDPRTLAMLSIVNPDGAKSIRETFQYFTNKTAGDLQSIMETPISDRSATYQTKLYEIGKSNPYFDTSKYPKEYSREVDAIIKADLIANQDLKREYSLQDTAQGLVSFEKNTGEISPTGLGVYQRPPTSVVNVGIDNKEESSFYKEFGKGRGQEYSNMLKNSRNSAANISKLNQAEKLYNDIGKTGILTPSTVKLGNIANQLGIKVDKNKIGNIEQLISLSKEQAGAILASGQYGAGTAISEADLAAAQSRVFSAQNTVDGAKLIIDTQRRLDKRTVEAGRLVNKMTGEKRPLDQIETALQDLSAKPLFSQDKKNVSPQQKPQQSQGGFRFVGFE